MLRLFIIKMEIQDSLQGYDKNLDFKSLRHIVKLKPNKNSLEQEKKKFIQTLMNFIDSIDFQKKQYNGRPRFYLNDIVKSLLMMCYHGMSYRRAESDLEDLQEKGIIKQIPKRSTLNKYMCLKETKKLIESVIQVSALFFKEQENTIICDSTWLATRMYTGGYRRVYDKKSTSLQKCRKLHIACLKNSKIIACAKVSVGTSHDSPHFKDIIMKVVRNGFDINYILADAGYSSKDNYAFYDTLNIQNIFIDFQKNASLKRAKSIAWRKQLKMFKENPELWHEKYRFRVIVEGIFSAIKRKQINYLRARIETAQDVELLLKVLVYNLTVIGKYF